MNEADLKTIKEGIRLATLRRAEYNYSGAAKGERQSNPIQISLTAYIPSVEAPDNSKAILGPKELKIYSELLIKAWHEKVYGAYRLLFYCKALDPFENGIAKGKVSKSGLRRYLFSLGMIKKTIDRWILKSLELGLIRYSKEYHSYFLLSIGNAAIKIGCENIGKASIISAFGLMEVGNRSLVWAGYETNFNERPISQATKRELVGVDERTQRNYLRSMPGEAIGNYAHTRYFQDETQGLNQEDKTHCFVFRGVVYQRLPNIRKVPRSVARPCSSGRRKKIQRIIDRAIHTRKLLPCKREREPGSKSVRIFCESDKEIKASKKRIQYLDIVDYQKPTDLFKLQVRGMRSNRFERIKTDVQVF